MPVSTRHLIFAGLFVLIAIVMVSGIRLDTAASPETQRMYDYIDGLPPGSVLIVSFDHEASSLPEIRPIATALLRHCFERGHRLVGFALLAEGTAIGYRLMEKIAAEYGREYGEDYVYLGFKPQFIAAILSMGESFPTTFPEDYLGHRFEDLPLARDLRNYDDVAAVLSIADGSLTTHWVEYAGARYRLRVVAGVTAAMVTTYDPYLASGQIHAMIGGLRGAAEYEGLTGREGGGVRGMLAQTTAHLYVIALIVLGNLTYFRMRQRRRRG
jgi:hypothetical protein